MKDELRQLWKDTFGDTDIYLNLFFDHIYKEANVICRYKEGKIIAALHIIPYQMTIHGKIIPVSYICGVATIPEERGKGIMKSLMKEAHIKIRERGDELAVLIPASEQLFNYYKKMGYKNFFYYQQRVYKETDTYKSCVLIPGRAIPEEELFNFFDQQIRKRRCCILHDYADFSNILKDVEVSNGCVKVLMNNDCRIKAIGFFYPAGENEMVIKDIVSTNEVHKDILLFKMQQQNPALKLIVREPYTDGNKIPFGMIYPVNNTPVSLKQDETGFMSLMLE